MRSVFMGSEKNIDYVYDEASFTKLHELCDLTHTPIITKENIESYAEDLKDTEFAFSTWGMEHYTVEEIKKYFPSLRALFYAAGTVKDFAKEFLEAGVKVFSAWGANAVPVAEYAVSQIILANKGFYTSLHLCTQNPADRDAAVSIFKAHRGNYGARIGLLGLGMIGTMVAERLRDYKLEVVAFDPFCSPERAASLGVSLVDIDEVFSTCDVISNHLANKPEIEGIINHELIFSMKETATFINTGRGAQVDEEALAEFMAFHPFATAVLDVTHPEPPLPSSPLFGKMNIYLTPHIAGSSGDEVHRMAEYMYEECKHFIDGEPTKWEVTSEMLKTMA